jgi:chromosome segregation ATPase
MRFLRVVLVLVLVLVGCSNRAPSCKEALDKAARTLGEDASGTIKELTAECERSGWTAEQRSCIANAQDKMTLAACAIVMAATKSREESQAAQQAVQAKQDAIKQAQEAMDRAKDKLDKAAKDLEVFEARLMKAQDELMHAQNDADRASAGNKLAALGKEKAEFEAQLTAAKAEADNAARAMEGKLEPVKR